MVETINNIPDLIRIETTTEHMMESITKKKVAARPYIPNLFYISIWIAMACRRFIPINGVSLAAQ